MEGRTHIQRVGHGHNLVRDHGIPVLSGKEFVSTPVEGEIGVTQAQVVDGGIVRTSKVTFDKGRSLCPKHLWPRNLNIQPGGDGKHIRLPAVVDVVALVVAYDGLRVEKHHVFAPAHHTAAVGIVVRVHKAMEVEVEALLGF